MVINDIFNQSMTKPISIIKVVKYIADVIERRGNIMFKKLIVKMFITAIFYIPVCRFRNMHFGTESNKVMKITDTRINIKVPAILFLLEVSITSNNVLLSVLKHVALSIILNISWMSITSCKHLKSFSHNPFMFRSPKTKVNCALHRVFSNNTSIMLQQMLLCLLWG